MSSRKGVANKVWGINDLRSWHDVWNPLPLIDNLCCSVGNKELRISLC